MGTRDDVGVSSIDLLLANSRNAHLGGGGTAAEPRLKVAVVTCMDARIDVFKLLGLRPGDAHVVRNAGGRATDDVVRSLAVSQSALGTEEVMVVHHTGCAALEPDDDPAAVLRAAVEHLRGSAALPHRDQVRGFIYDLGRQTLDEVGV